MAGIGKYIFIGVAGAAVIAACGGSDPEPQTQFQAGAGHPSAQPYPNQGYPPQQQGYPPQQQGYPPQQQGYPPQQQGYPPATQPGAAPAATAAPQMPALPGVPMAQAGPAAQPLDASAGTAAQPILNQLANTDAPGAKPLGATTVGMFQAGQQLETVVQLQPGKCYTVLGVGLPPVTEVNVQLVAAAPIPGAAPVLAQDQTTGPQAVLGKAPNCFKWPLPMPGPVKVVTTVAAGAGVAAVQVYEK